MTSLDSILAAKYPAKAHARRVAEALKAHGDAGLIYLEAQKTRLIEDNDEAMPFRQRRPFFYLTGCLLPDSSMAYDIKADQLTLFVPPIDPDSVIWSGLPLSAEEAAKLYDVDRVLYTTDVNATLASIASAQGGKTVAFAIEKQISEGVEFKGFAEAKLAILKDVIGDARVVKDAYEVALLRKANDISAKAHIAAIKASKTATNERDMEAAFLSTCVANNCREQSYHPIFAGGENGATLHYVKNDESLTDAATQKRKGNLLIDAGCEYQTYCADITRVIPLAGRFPTETRQIYEIVLEMQTECIAMLKEGVRWDDVHALAHRVAIKGLLKLGILRGTEDELFEKRVSVAFFPHGLGHYLGMDTHDTGGYPNYDDSDKMFRYLRVRRNLPAGAVITVEPGIYFCRFIIDPVLKSAELGKYIDADVLERYWSVGGVRIEDNIHITKDGCENLTSAPKAIEEVESLAH
jgi:Xaa-Pro dipeptidase